MQIFISDVLKQVILTYPKVGSSTLRYLLLEGEEYLKDEWSNPKISQSIAESDSNSMDQYFGIIPDNYTVHILMRDPCERYVSGFLYVTQEPNEFNYFNLDAVGESTHVYDYYVGQVRDWWLDTISSRIVRHCGCASLNNLHMYRNLHMVLCAVVYFSLRNKNVHLYDLNDISDVFSNIYGKNITLPKINASGVYGGESENMRAMKKLLSDRLKHLLKNIILGKADYSDSSYHNKDYSFLQINDYLDSEIKIYNLLKDQTDLRNIYGYDSILCHLLDHALSDSSSGNERSTKIRLAKNLLYLLQSRPFKRFVNNKHNKIYQTFSQASYYETQLIDFIGKEFTM